MIVGTEKKIHGRDALPVVSQEGLPTVDLIRRSGPPGHIARDSSLGNVESQLLELAMYARCAPTVVVGHPPDQLTDFEINSRTARRAFSRLPRPEDTEALAMPPNDRVRLYDDEGITPVRPNAMKKDPEETVVHRKRWTGSLLLEYGELLSQRGVLDREMHAAMEARDECAEQREEGANHARRLRILDNTDKANSSVIAVRSALWRATTKFIRGFIRRLRRKAAREWDEYEHTVVLVDFEYVFALDAKQLIAGSAPSTPWIRLFSGVSRPAALALYIPRMPIWFHGSCDSR